MKIRFTQQDRLYQAGFVMDTGAGVAAEYIKRGVAVKVDEQTGKPGGIVATLKKAVGK
jgi:hypothetical protein